MWTLPASGQTETDSRERSGSLQLQMAILQLASPRRVQTHRHRNQLASGSLYILESHPGILAKQKPHPFSPESQSRARRRRAIRIVSRGFFVIQIGDVKRDPESPTAHQAADSGAVPRPTSHIPL